MSRHLSAAPWTWINADAPNAIEWARAALAQPHCNAVIISRRPVDGSTVNAALETGLLETVLTELDRLADLEFGAPTGEKP
jgi:hypothetical protein